MIHDGKHYRIEASTDTRMWNILKEVKPTRRKRITISKKPKVDMSTISEFEKSVIKAIQEYKNSKMALNYES